MSLRDASHHRVDGVLKWTRVPSLLDAWAGALQVIQSSLTAPADPWPSRRWGAFDYVRSLRFRTELETTLAPLRRDPEQGFDVLDALDSWSRTFTIEDTDHLLSLVTDDIPTDAWWWSRIPVSGAILDDLRRYQADPNQVEVDREVHTNRVHPGRLETVDRHARLSFSRDLIIASFESHLWDAINDKYDLLIDEYEEEEIPIDLLAAVASDLRTFDGQPKVSDQVRKELAAAAEFLDTHAWPGQPSGWSSRRIRTCCPQPPGHAAIRVAQGQCGRTMYALAPPPVTCPRRPAHTRQAGTCRCPDG